MAHLAPLIRDLAVILGVAGLVTLLFHRIRQPVVLGYIVAGLIIGPHTPPFPLVTDIPNIKTLAELGVIFVMFALGLEFYFKKLKPVGATSSVTGLFEIAFMLVIGFITGKLLGFKSIDAIFLASMVAISSTTIIVKAFEELGLKRKRFAEQVIGVLVIEDLVAILLLVGLTTLVTQGVVSAPLLAAALGKLVLVLGTWFLAGYFVIPRVMRFVVQVRSDEMLFVFSLGLCLFLVVVAASFGYSPALGAFIMGSILAECRESHRISGLIRPLRDLFGAIFFVSIGMLIDPRMLISQWEVMLAVSAVVILGKWIGVSVGGVLGGQNIQDSVRMGMSQGQIGEFSFIIATLGITTKAMSPELFPIIVGVSVLTTFLTPYALKWAPSCSEKIESRLPRQVHQWIRDYGLFLNRRHLLGALRIETQRQWTRWFLSAFIVSLIHILVSEVISGSVSRWIAWGLSIVLSSPFIAAMLTRFDGWLRVLAQVATVILIGFFSFYYFNAWKVIGFTLALSSIPMVLGFRTLEGAYRKLEQGFTSVFRTEDDEEEGHTSLAQKRSNERRIHLAPWDARLLSLVVHPNSWVAGKTLAETGLRNQYGVNVVVIERGKRSFVAPLPSHVIYPGDVLLVLASEDAIEKARMHIEVLHSELEAEELGESFEMKTIQLNPKSGDGNTLIGRTIRDAGVRENFGLMVVGVERDQRRILNPESDTVLQAGDAISIVGHRDAIARFAQSL